MDRLDALYNRLHVRGFVVNSLPKSGTNLVKKAIAQFPGIRDSGERVFSKPELQFSAGELAGQEQVAIGIGQPAAIPARVLQQSLDKLGRARHAAWHVPYDPTTAAMLARNAINMVIVMRDPRDVVFSQVRYVMKLPDHRLHAHYASLPEHERVIASICGIPAGPAALVDIKTRCQMIMQWRDYSRTYLTTFERLVGPQGGGDRATQLAELAAVARHLGIRTSRARLDAIVDTLFGGTSTFHKGAIGGWREVITPEQKDVFKAVAGEILIDLGYERDMDW